MIRKAVHNLFVRHLIHFRMDIKGRVDNLYNFDNYQRETGFGVNLCLVGLNKSVRKY